MIDTSHINLEAMINTPLKKVASNRGGEYHGPCPFCGGEDRFALWPAENKWSCRQCVDADMTPKDAIDFVMRRDSIGFGEAMAQLGIGNTENGHAPSTTLSPQAYAAAHGLDWEDLQRAGFQSVTYHNSEWAGDPCNGRPALEFQTRGGKRWRFLDTPDHAAGKPKYKSERGFKPTWYGLDDKVMDNARKEHAPLVICNGEVSALAARFWGVPAITIAGGAEHSIDTSLLEELCRRWDGRIAIAMDCDEHGRKAAQKIKDQLGERGAIIDLQLQAGQDLADFVRLYGAGSTKELKRRMPIPPQSPMTNREAARRTIARLDINNTMTGKPVVIPFRSWHELGGYARIGWPGKLTCGVGMSGHGKTSWINTGIDQLLKRGDIGVGLMPEFDGDEYNWDRLQRYSGHDPAEPLVTADKMMQWELWKKEHELGFPVDNRDGRPLTDAEQDVVRRISTEVENWPGEFNLFPLNTSLEDALQAMGDDILDRRARGQLVTFAAFDYIQILRAQGRDDTDNSYEHILSLIKHFCMRYQIHGMVTSQVNKTADKAARDYNQMLTSTDMRYARDDRINLLVTLNILYDETGQMMTVGNTPYYAGVANIAKNNKGRKGKIRMLADFRHLRWLDKPWNRHQVDLLDDEPVEPVTDEQLADL